MRQSNHDTLLDIAAVVIATIFLPCCVIAIIMFIVKIAAEH